MINTSIKVIILFKLPNFLTPFFYFSFVFWGRRSPHDQEICQSAQCPRGDEGLTRLSREINRHTLLCPPIPLPPIPPSPYPPSIYPLFDIPKGGSMLRLKFFLEIFWVFSGNLNTSLAVGFTGKIFWKILSKFRY